MISTAPTPIPSPGKQRVLEAAQALFTEGSYGDVGVAQILERAGVQPPTLYHHFGDKEGLFVIWAEQALLNVEEVVHASAGGANTTDALTRYGTALLSAVNFDVHQILRDALRLQRAESCDRVYGAYMRAVYEPLATILVQAVATGEFRSEPVGQLNDVFLGGLLALRNSRTNVDLASQAAWWCNAFARAFGAERAAVYR